MTPRVTVCIPLELRRLAGDQDTIVIDAATVGEALAALFDRHPDMQSRVLDGNGELYPYLVLVHNQEMITLATARQRPLHQDDRLELLALASGG